MSIWYSTVDLFSIEFFTKLIIILGNLSIIILYTIPTSDMIEIYKTKKTDKFPYLILVVSIINCFFWLLYGLITQQIGIIMGNSFGITLNTIFWIIYLYCMNINTKNKLFLTIFTLVSIPLFFRLWLWSGVTKEVTGTFALLFSMTLSVSPMQNIRKCIEEKDSSYIPIRIVCVAFISAVIWFIYGLIKMDLIVLVPNIWALLTSSIQIYFYLKNSDSKTVNEDSSETTMYLKDSTGDGENYIDKNKNRVKNQLEKKSNNNIDDIYKEVKIA